MKYTLILVLLACFAKLFSQPFQITIKDPDSFDAIKLEFEWSDEFDKVSLDTSIWTTTYPWQSRWLIGSHEQEYMKDQNVEIGNGALKLILKNEPGLYKIQPWESDTVHFTAADGSTYQNLSEFKYTSGVVSTKKQFLYGYYELRFKVNIPPQKLNQEPFLTSHVPGIWPAFWFRGANLQKNGEFEIDAFEIQTQCPSRFYAAVHSTKNPKFDNSHPHLFPSDYVNNFVRLGILWTPDRIIWVYDDKEESDFFVPTSSCRAFVKVDAPLNIILSLAMGNVPINSKNYCDLQTGPTSQTDDALPSNFEIDYLRFYKYSKGNINIYPNPFTSKINVFTEEFNFNTMSIYNLQGNLVYKVDVYFSSVDLSVLQPGIYIAKFSNGNERIVKKIIKTE